MAQHQLVLNTNTENGLRIEAGFLYEGRTKNAGESTLDFIHRCVCEDMRKKVQVCEAAAAAGEVVIDPDIVN